MTETLTLSDCMKYPNAKITSLTGITIFANVRILIEYAYKSGLSVLNVLDSFKLKLILRDITELTDEEKQHIAKEYLFGVNPDRDIWEIGKLIYRSMNTYNDRDNTIPLINYLRSKNILVEPEDWFKQGKAVRE